MRLTEIGYDIGLVSQRRYDFYMKKMENVEREIKRLKNVFLSPTDEVIDYLEKQGSAVIKSGVSLYDLLKRPEVDYNDIEKLEGKKADLNRQEKEQVQVRIKYKGYIDKQIKQARQFKKMESRLLPEDISYSQIPGLRIEAQQKLDKIKPRSIGQASRISGVSPADISVLLVHMEKMRRDRDTK